MNTDKQNNAANARTVLANMRRNGIFPSQQSKFQSHPTPLRAIRLFCLQCQANSRKAVKQCQDTSCPLWLFRTKNTAKSQISSEKPL